MAALFSILSRALRSSAYVPGVRTSAWIPSFSEDSTRLAKSSARSSATAATRDDVAVLGEGDDLHCRLLSWWLAG